MQCRHIFTQKKYWIHFNESYTLKQRKMKTKKKWREGFSLSSTRRMNSRHFLGYVMRVWNACVRGRLQTAIHVDTFGIIVPFGIIKNASKLICPLACWQIHVEYEEYDGTRTMQYLLWRWVIDCWCWILLKYTLWFH